MRKQQGFTLFEIMIVVAIIGILAAIAIPMFMTYTKHAKTTEAGLQLSMLSKAAKTYYQATGSYPQGTAGAQPGADGAACSAPDGKLPVSVGWFSDPVWLDLAFHVDEPTMFSYHYESTSPTTAKAFAVGDIDCDKKLATYTIELSAPDGTPSASFIAPVKGTY
jgi:prepilin-type N-terminal cleavage/methylation domain-containing protein